MIGKRDKNDKDSPEAILIVDAKNTGRILHGCRWGHGLHAFLEIKHNLEIKKESLVPTTMSNASFYQMYHSIFGHIYQK